MGAEIQAGGWAYLMQVSTPSSSSTSDRMAAVRCALACARAAIICVLSPPVRPLRTSAQLSNNSQGCKVVTIKFAGGTVQFDLTFSKTEHTVAQQVHVMRRPTIGCHNQGIQLWIPSSTALPMQSRDVVITNVPLTSRDLHRDKGTLYGTACV